jgi:hypothetical protein
VWGKNFLIFTLKFKYMVKSFRVIDYVTDNKCKPKGVFSTDVLCSIPLTGSIIRSDNRRLYNDLVDL